MNRNVRQAQRAGKRQEEEGGPVYEIAVPQLRNEREWALFLETKFIMWNKDCKMERGKRWRETEQHQIT